MKLSDTDVAKFNHLFSELVVPYSCLQFKESIGEGSIHNLKVCLLFV